MYAWYEVIPHLHFLQRLSMYHWNFTVIVLSNLSLHFLYRHSNGFCWIKTDDKKLIMGKNIMFESGLKIDNRTVLDETKMEETMKWNRLR